MYKNRSQGFTLIELLVVIAIIGILSAVVLASLNTARTRGNDAAIQSNLAAVRTQAEIYYGSTGGNTYGVAQTTAGSCAAQANTIWADSTIVRSIAATEVTNGAGTVVCNSSPTAYAVSSALLSGIGGNMFWCIDSTGNATAQAAALAAGDTQCP